MANRFECHKKPTIACRFFYLKALMQNIIEAKDNILCYLGDWCTASSTVNRNKGEAYSYRFAVVAATHCWGLVEYRENASSVYHKYATSFADLCIFFRSIANVAIHDGLNKVAGSLEKLQATDEIGLLQIGRAHV